MSIGEEKKTVGYKQPPKANRFQKGQSGNPGGRPRGVSRGKFAEIFLEEAYRMLPVKEGSKNRRLQAVRALIRAQIADGIRGNAGERRAVLQALAAIEAQVTAEADAKQAELTARENDLDRVASRMTREDTARLLAFVLAEALRKAQEEKARTNSPTNDPTSLEAIALGLIKVDNT